MALQLQSPPPVHICGRKLETARHACVFFNGRDEEYAIMAPFVQEGLAQQERIVQIVDGSLVGDHDDRLRRAGVAIDEARKRDQYAVVTSEAAYFEDGDFDQHRTLATLEALLADRKARGFPQLRITGNMEWALSQATTESLLEYETRVTMISRNHSDPLVCFYDINQFDAPALLDIMRTHPAVVIGGAFHENPYFVAPERMLREIESRRAGR